MSYSLSFGPKYDCHLYVISLFNSCELRNFVFIFVVILLLLLLSLLSLFVVKKLYGERGNEYTRAMCEFV